MLDFMDTTKKSLQAMPKQVEASAWYYATTAQARFMRMLSDWLFILRDIGLVTWLFVLICLPIAGAISFMDDARTLHLIFLMLPALVCVTSAILGVAWHRSHVALLVPRADRSYPLIWGLQNLPPLGYPLAKQLLWAPAAYLFLSIYPGTTIRLWVIVAAAATTLAVAAVWLVTWLNPSWGERVPSKEEIEKAGKQAAAAEAAREAAQQEAAEYPLTIAPREARTTFADIHGMRDLKSRLLAAGQEILAQREAGTEVARNGVLLHGEPGNGKTAMVEAWAGELKIPVISVTYGDVSSKWLGQMPKVMSRIFALARESAPCVLFIDEVDSFLRSRDSGTNNPEELKVTNTLLTELVEIRRHGVVLVAATNYLQMLDPAAIREGRFDYKIEITPPDDEARVGLLMDAGRKHSKGASLDEEGTKLAAKRWAGFSVSRLLAIAKALPAVLAAEGKNTAGYAEWVSALRSVQGRKGQSAAGAKRLSELVMVDDTKEALELLANRLKDVERIHSLGGTLPTGVLFYGPSGTGKTAAAKALALECGWAFLPVAGPDLVSDRNALDKLHREAKDLRPALVFIDEADDLLRNRQFSGTPDVVNKLLVMMDGAQGSVPDVVFVAATNNPDQIDPALLRSGRFTEKVEFHPPPSDQVPRAVANWLKAKKVALAAGLSPFDVAELLEGATMANIEGALQYALNRAIGRCAAGETPTLTEEDLKAAVRVVRT